jgi:hypothetical protein
MLYRFAVLLLLLGTTFGLNADEKASNLSFVVVKADSGKPIRNASIVLHPVAKDGKQTHAGFELKTDNEGRASFPGAPYGKLRVQVLVRGFQTFGEDYDISRPDQEITIKLQRPKEQYSIYGDKPAEEKPKN